MSGLAIWAAFIGILIAPFPGGGRVASIAFADMNDLTILVMLLLVITASLIESFIIMVLPARWSWLKNKRERVKKLGVMKRITKAEQTHWRYATVMSLPFLPVGGGTLFAFGAAHIWELHPSRIAVVIGSMNVLAFLLYLFAAQSVGWIVIGLIVGSALVVQKRTHLIRLANWSRPKLAALSGRT